MNQAAAPDHAALLAAKYEALRTVCSGEYDTPHKMGSTTASWCRICHGLGYEPLSGTALLAGLFSVGQQVGYNALFFYPGSAPLRWPCPNGAWMARVVPDRDDERLTAEEYGNACKNGTGPTPEAALAAALWAAVEQR